MKLIAAMAPIFAVAAAGFFVETAEVLPDSIAGWQAAGGMQVYVGDDLFTYIDGGAEVHREYGFDRVFVRDYMRGDDIIAVEVYRMTNAAFGLFSFTRSSEDEPVALGSGGALSDYYLAFWSGNDMVVVTAQTEFESNKQSVLEVGRELAKKFPASGAEPEMMALLPEEGKVANSEKYIAGPVVMQNVAYSVGRFFSGYKEAVAAEYRLPSGAEGILMAVRWTDAATVAAALDEALGRARDAGIRFRRADDGAVSLALDDGDQIEIRVNGAIAWMAVAKGETAGELIAMRTAS
jgi:hypothetical protein